MELFIFHNKLSIFTVYDSLHLDLKSAIYFDFDVCQRLKDSQILWHFSCEL